MVKEIKRMYLVENKFGDTTITTLELEDFEGNEYKLSNVILGQNHYEPSWCIK